MNKLRLHVDELEIESFETLDQETETVGSVEGMQSPTANSGGSCFDPTCRPILCRTEDTCPADSCNYTCPWTCDDYTCQC